MSLFGLNAGAARPVASVLIELPLMLGVVRVVDHSRGGHQRVRR